MKAKRQKVWVVWQAWGGQRYHAGEQSFKTRDKAQALACGRQWAKNEGYREAQAPIVYTVFWGGPLALGFTRGFTSIDKRGY